MARPISKENPVKKTLYLEQEALTKLAILAKEDQRSQSTYVQRLIEKEWAKAHPVKPKAAAGARSSGRAPRKA